MNIEEKTKREDKGGQKGSLSLIKCAPLRLLITRSKALRGEQKKRKEGGTCSRLCIPTSWRRWQGEEVKGKETNRPAPDMLGLHLATRRSDRKKKKRARAKTSFSNFISSVRDTDRTRKAREEKGKRGKGCHPSLPSQTPSSPG